MRTLLASCIPFFGRWRWLFLIESVRQIVGRFLLVSLAVNFLYSGAAAFEVKAPTGWQSQYNLPPSVVLQAFSPDTGSGFRANIISTRGQLPCCREESTSPESLIAKVSRQQARVLPLYKVLEKRQRKLGGREGGFLLSSYAQGEKDLACFQFFYLEGQDFVNVVYTCLLKDLQRLRSEFEKSLATLKTGPAEKGAAVKP